MPGEGCRDHATTIEECMGCNGGRWDPEAADELIEAGYAVGITAAAIRVARAEIDRLRADRDAGAERVRTVVALAIANEMREYRVADDGTEPPMTLLDRERATLFTAIADRVAAQFGPVGLGDGERFSLVLLASDRAFRADHPAAAAVLDRLLGDQP